MLLGFQACRPDWYQQQPQLEQLMVPMLVVVGDEDEPCVAPALYLKRVVPACGVALLPQCGHAPNAEEPDKFNSQLSDFLHQVAAGRWVELGQHQQDEFSKSMVGNKSKFLNPINSQGDKN